MAYHVPRNNAIAAVDPDSSEGGEVWRSMPAEPTAPSTTKEHEMLNEGRVATRLPAQDLTRARAFYADKLGLHPAEEREGGLRYVCAAGEFALFESAGGPSGDHTQMGWEVDDIEATVAELRSSGVTFEEYDMPGLKTVDGIADIEGNYPSKGVGERGAWFRDSEGNMLGIGQPLGPGPTSRPRRTTAGFSPECRFEKRSGTGSGSSPRSPASRARRFES